MDPSSTDPTQKIIEQEEEDDDDDDDELKLSSSRGTLTRKELGSVTKKLTFDVDTTTTTSTAAAAAEEKNKYVRFTSSQLAFDDDDDDNSCNGNDENVKKPECHPDNTQVVTNALIGIEELTTNVADQDNSASSMKMRAQFFETTPISPTRNISLPRVRSINDENDQIETEPDKELLQSNRNKNISSPQKLHVTELPEVKSLYGSKKRLSSQVKKVVIDHETQEEGDSFQFCDSTTIPSFRSGSSSRSTSENEEEEEDDADLDEEEVEMEIIRTPESKTKKKYKKRNGMKKSNASKKPLEPNDSQGDRVHDLDWTLSKHRKSRVAGSEDEEIDSNALWNAVWKLLKSYGWTHKKGGGLVDWYYLAPQIDKSSGKDYELNKTLFHSEESLIDFLKSTDPSIIEEAKTSIRKISSNASQERQTKSNPSVVVSKRSKEKTKPSKSSLADETINMKVENNIMLSSSSMFCPTADEVFQLIWNPLKSMGWTYEKGTGLVDWFYCCPGVKSTTNGVIGETMFCSTEEVVLNVSRDSKYVSLVENVLKDLGSSLKDFLNQPSSQRRRNKRPKVLLDDKMYENRQSSKQLKVSSSNTGSKRKKNENDGNSDEEVDHESDDSGEDEKDDISFVKSKTLKIHGNIQSFESPRSQIKSVSTHIVGLTSSKKPSYLTSTGIGKSPVAKVTPLALASNAILNKAHGNLFANMQFELCGFSKKDRGAPRLQDMKSFIENQQGKITSTIDQTSSSSNNISSSVFMIASPTSYTHPKYIASIARGVPALHYDWILESISENEILPWHDYILPSGFSFMRNVFVFDDTWDRYLNSPAGAVFEYPKSLPLSKRVFFKRRFAFLLADEFAEMLVKEAGGEIVPLQIAEKDKSVYIFTGSYLKPEEKPPAQWTKLVSLGSKVYSFEWLMYSIVDNYIFDYSEKWDPIYHRKVYPDLSSSTNDTETIYWISNPARFPKPYHDGDYASSREYFTTCIMDKTRFNLNDFVIIENDSVRILEASNVSPSKSDTAKVAFIIATPSSSVTLIRYGRIKSLYQTDSGQRRVHLDEFVLHEDMCSLTPTDSTLDCSISYLSAKFVCIKSHEARRLRYITRSKRIHWKDRVYALTTI